MDERSAVRFWPKVDKQPNGCWLWIACRTPEGYGLFKPTGARMEGAHRFAYKALVGPIPEGLVLDHLCRNPPCVNPAHLEPVTQRENVLRSNHPAALNARKTHCPQGHPYDPENTRIKAGRRRVCRTCDREAGRRAIAKRSERRAAARAAKGLPPYVERRAAYRKD